LATFLLFTQLISITPVLADSNDTVTIDVNVTEAASIVVVPETLNWSNAVTGQAGGIQNLTIKNAGSLNVSQIHAYIDTLTTENARPYGSSEPTDFSAGGVIVLKNETDSTYLFAGRIEWNWTQDIPNHDWSALTTSDPTSWGYFRNTSSDYVWVVGNGTDGRCNESSAQFALETEVDIGTIGTRTPTLASITRDTGDADWGYFSVGQAPLNGACVAVSTDCTKIYIYKYDMRGTDPYAFNNCGNAAYVQAVNLTPGYTITLQTDAWIPNGYPAGFLNTTTLTVYATS
jgi:hypothetical protein